MSVGQPQKTPEDNASQLQSKQQLAWQNQNMEISWDTLGCIIRVSKDKFPISIISITVT